MTPQEQEEVRRRQRSRSIIMAVLLNRATETKAMGPEKRLFGFSVLYLFAIFGALVADKWLGA